MTVVDVDGLLGLGLAPKTAYVYARVIERCEGILAERGTDLINTIDYRTAS